MGGKIVEHSFRLLFRNLSDALKISVGPYLIAIVLSAIVLLVTAVPLDVALMALREGGQHQIPGGPLALLGMLLVMLIVLFVSGWVGVSWHRFILREEYPAILPSLSDKPIWPYVGKTLLLGIVIVVISIPVGLVLGLTAAALIGGPDAAGAPVAGFAVGLILGSFLSWLWLRWGLILPATAVARPMTMSESWNATRPLSGAIFTALLILVALNLVVSLVVGLVLGDNIVSAIISLVIDWISLMIGISILTTLYGHIVEGRPID